MAIVRVFSGTDPVLLDKAVRDAVKAALGDESADFALAELTESDYQVDDGYSIAPLVDAAQTPPMLTDRRVVLGHIWRAFYWRHGRTACRLREQSS